MRASQRWLAVPLGLVLTVAGCASGSKSPTVASVGTGPTTTAAQAGASSPGGGTQLAKGLAYALCMRGHGVPNFPDPVANRSGGYGFLMQRGSINPQSPAYVAAQEACTSLLPEWWTGQQLSPAQEQAWLTWAKCIRANGVPSFADPSFAGGHVAINDGGAAGSPQLQAAQQACKSQMPSGGGVGG